MDLKISLEIHATQVIYTNLDNKIVLQLKAQDLDKEKYGTLKELLQQPSSRSALHHKTTTSREDNFIIYNLYII